MSEKCGDKEEEKEVQKVLEDLNKQFISLFTKMNLLRQHEKQLMEMLNDTTIIQTVPQILPITLQEQIQSFIKRVERKLLLSPGYTSSTKVSDELKELLEALDEADSQHITEEISDVLFCLIGYCAMYGISFKEIYDVMEEKTKKRFPEEL